MKHGRTAVVAEISEGRTTNLDEAIKPTGGALYRCANTAKTNAAVGALQVAVPELLDRQLTLQVATLINSVPGSESLVPRP